MQRKDTASILVVFPRSNLTQADLFHNFFTFGHVLSTTLIAKGMTDEAGIEFLRSEDSAAAMRAVRSWAGVITVTWNNTDKHNSEGRKRMGEPSDLAHQTKRAKAVQHEPTFSHQHHNLNQYEARPPYGQVHNFGINTPAPPRPEPSQTPRRVSSMAVIPAPNSAPDPPPSTEPVELKQGGSGKETDNKVSSRCHIIELADSIDRGKLAVRQTMRHLDGPELEHFENMINLQFSAGWCRSMVNWVEGGCVGHLLVIDGMALGVRIAARICVGCCICLLGVYKPFDTKATSARAYSRISAHTKGDRRELGGHVPYA